jgi:hypothetical protein
MNAKDPLTINPQFEDEEPARPIDPNYENPDPFDHRTHRSSWSDEEKQNVGIDGVRMEMGKF